MCCSAFVSNLVLQWRSFHIDKSPIALVKFACRCFPIMALYFPYTDSINAFAWFEQDRYRSHMDAMRLR